MLKEKDCKVNVPNLASRYYIDLPSMIYPGTMSSFSIAPEQSGQVEKEAKKLPQKNSLRSDSF